MARPLSLALAALALLCASVPAHADLDLRTRRLVFQTVWQKVRDTHWDPKLGGVDWVAVRKRYAPQVERARDDAAFYALVGRMLGELKQSHFGLVPPDAYVALQARGRGGGETGLTIGLVEGAATVVAVESGSAAEAAGLRPGFVVTALDDKPVLSVLERIRATRLRPALELLEVRMAFRALLTGEPGSHVTVAFRNADEVASKVQVERRARSREMVQFGQLPPVPIECEVRRLDGGFGYVRFNIFLMPLLSRVQQAFQEFADAPGIVLDLRGNPGGLGIMATPIAGYLARAPYDLGTMRSRRLTAHFPVTPQPPRYGGPVVVLTDEASLSTAEILAAGMQEAGRAFLIGRTTGGMVLPSQLEQLPGGARLQFAVADFRTRRGILLEGRGVAPDLAVPLTRASLLASADPTLDAALNYLRKEGQRKP